MSPVEDFPVEKWDGLIGVMLTAPFLFIKHLLPDMKKKGIHKMANCFGRLILAFSESIIQITHTLREVIAS